MSPPRQPSGSGTDRPPPPSGSSPSSHRPGAVRLPLEGRRILFVGGKGGVGKTTLAGAIALRMAEAGERVLLVSTDPAHSLADLFATPIGDEICPLAPGLHALEIDPDAQVEEYLREVRRNLKSFVRPAMYPEIERQIDLTRHAPGAVEAALLDRVAELMDDRAGEYDRIVFDTAPTGHTLRLLALPEVMQAWTDGLLRSRDRSDAFSRGLERLKGAAARRLGGSGEPDPEEPDTGEPDPDEQDLEPPASAGTPPEDDPKRSEGDPDALQTPGEGRGDDLSWFDRPDDGPADPRGRRIREVLLARRRKFSRARRLLLDPEETAFLLVLTPERLPILESRKALDALRRHEVPIAGMVVNRVLPEAAEGGFMAQRREQEKTYLARIDREFSDLPRIRIPLLAKDVEGVAGLHEVAKHLP